MSLRLKQLYGMVDEFLRTHHAWAASGDERPNPDKPYWDTLDEMKTFFLNGEIPGECRLLDEAVFKLVLEEKKWDERLDHERQYPPNAFWAAVENLEKVRKGQFEREEVRPLESIDELHRQGVSTNQIARMWDIKAWQVLMYLDKDGEGNRKWNFPADFVPPNMRGRNTEDATARAAYESAMARSREIAERNAPKVKETVEQLLREGVSPRQIARMHNITEYDVGAVAQKLNIPLPKNVTVESLKNEKPETPAVGVGTSPALPSSPDGPVDVRQEIIRLSAESYTNGEIAKHLSKWGVTEDQVMKTLMMANGARLQDVVIPEKEEQPSERQTVTVE